MFLPEEHRTMHFKTTGKVVYDPVRAGKVAKETGWCVIEIHCGDLMAYYAWQFYKKFGIILDRPSWEPHISVIAGEGSFDETVEWGWRDKEIVEVTYSHYMFWNDKHVWIAAASATSDEIRKRYSGIAKDRGHITIGRIPVKQKDAIPAFRNFQDFEVWRNYPFNTPLI